jgi:hypothetical protein
MSGVSIFHGPFDLGPGLLDFQGLDQILAELPSEPFYPPVPFFPPQPLFPLFPLVLHLGDTPPSPVYPPQPV